MKHIFVKVRELSAMSAASVNASRPAVCCGPRQCARDVSGRRLRASDMQRPSQLQRSVVPRTTSGAAYHKATLLPRRRLGLVGRHCGGPRAGPDTRTSYGRWSLGTGSSEAFPHVANGRRYF